MESSDPYDGNLLLSTSPELAFMPTMFLISIASTMIPDRMEWRYIMLALTVMIIIILIVFFRSPEIDKSSYNKLNSLDLVAPAEGQVVQIDEIPRQEAFKKYGDFIDLNKGPTVMPSSAPMYKRIVIYLGITNLHFQVTPADATLVANYHVSGSFHPAGFFDKSEHNERTILQMNVGRNGEKQETIALVLIAGLLARRIQNFPVFEKANDFCPRGSKISLIKFSSRVDLVIPSTYKILVKPGDELVIGETVVAKYAP